MSSIGRLLTPYTYVKWGELELSAWDYGDGKKRPVVYDVEFSLQQGDSKVNNASFSFDPSPVGFRAYSQCVGTETIQLPITIRFGYENGSFIETAYYFQDVEFVTGSEQSIKVNLVGLHKAGLTSSWWTEYIGDGSKEFTLQELWNEIAKKIGYEIVWAEDALAKMETLPLITRAALIKETAGSFLISTANKYGFYLEMPTASAEDHKKILVKINGLDSRSNDTLKVEEKTKKTGKEANGSERVNTRYAFILGPTLVGSVRRKTNPASSSGKSYADTAHSIRRGGGQSLSAGQLYSPETREPVKPLPPAEIPQEPIFENFALDPVANALKNQETLAFIAELVEVQPTSAQVAAPTAVENVIGEVAANKPPGTAKPTDKKTENCLTTKTGKKMTAGERLDCEKKLEDAKAKKEIGELSECSCEVFMVPYIVGIQPRDFVVFPSLSHSDPYIEDWEVKQVSYKQTGAAVVLSIEGIRPKPGADPLIIEGDRAKLEERVKSMKTLKDWESYYWNVV